MTEKLKQTFASKKAKNEAVFVTFVTAGYPSPNETVDIMLAMEKGGADIIELGLPFSDPMADGPTIQDSNNVALEHNVDVEMCFQFVRQAREKGLQVPVLLMGYYNPILSYGEEKAIKDAGKVGANGFILVDLPPEEAIQFRNTCTKEGLSYVPLIAPSTSEKRIQFLSGIADSFIYVVSKMGTTGSSSQVSASLPELVSRIRKHTNIPLAVGFGVSNHEHFETVADHANGVVIGSKIVTIIKDAPKGQAASATEKFCSEITLKNSSNRVKTVTTDEIVDSKTSLQHVTKNNLNTITSIDVDILPPRFGEFGGQYVPEALVDCLEELEEAHKAAMKDPAFWEEFESYYDYINRPSQLQLADRLTEYAGGANIWLKREDLNHTGSHKINNALGQILLAKRLGKKRIIAETGAGQHGVATATVCAKFGLECVIYMGSEDVRRQTLNAFRIKMLGGKVISVNSGSKTLKDAINEAMRDWVTNLSTTHYLVGSAIGPHPFPTIVRDFQSVIGKESKLQLMKKIGKLPDAVIACVGGGSNSIGLFHPFINEKNVRIIGVEAGGHGLNTLNHSATLTAGTKGVLHGVKTYILQSKVGQILGTHSISAGLDYPGVGPEHAWLKDTNRAEYIAVTDEQCLEGFRLMTEYEGIIPALETAHAIWGTIQLAKELGKGKDIIMCLSGRGDKDVDQLSKELPKYADKLNWHIF